MARFEMSALEASDSATAGGTPDVLFELGLMYCAGREVELDLVSAHKWFNLAAMRGNDDAKRYRMEIASEMSKAQIAEAQRQAREWLARPGGWRPPASRALRPGPRRALLKRRLEHNKVPPSLAAPIALRAHTCDGSRTRAASPREAARSASAALFPAELRGLLPAATTAATPQEDKMARAIGFASARLRLPGVRRGGARASMRGAWRLGRCHRHACDRGGLSMAFYFDLVLGLLGLFEGRGPAGTPGSWVRCSSPASSPWP